MDDNVHPCIQSTILDTSFTSPCLVLTPKLIIKVFMLRMSMEFGNKNVSYHMSIGDLLSHGRQMPRPGYI